MDDETRQLLDAFRQLTPRQAEVLRLLVQGLAREEIAQRLGVTPRVVVADISVIYRAFALDESGLTPAQRRLELRRIVAALRKREQQERPVPPPSLPVPPPAAEAPPEPERPPLAIVPRPAPIPTPPGSSQVWRWWSLAAVVLALIIGSGIWRVLHTAGPPLLTAARSAATTLPTVAVAVPVQTPTVAPAPTMTPGPSSPTPAPTIPPKLTTTATVNAAASPADLAGTVDSTFPGTPLQLGRVVTSVIDDHTKPRDLYALDLQAGTRFHLALTASSAGVAVRLGPAGALPSFAGGDPVLCSSLSAATSCATSLPIAQTGPYLLLVEAGGSGVRYTLQTTALPLVVPPGVTNLTGTVASNIPGTPLTLGTSVLSVVDSTTKRLDLYALHLLAGQALQVQISATPADEVVLLLPPDTAPFTGTPNWTDVPLICNGQIPVRPCDQPLPIATSGVYDLVIAARAPGVQYTLRVTAQ